VVASPTSGTTAADGTFSFNVTGQTAGYSYVNVTVTKGTVSSAATAVIRGVTQNPKVLALTASPDKLVLRPGETMALTVNVTDEVNNPVQGATVAIDPNLVGFGHMTANTVVTNADGGAIMTYNAPALPEFNVSAMNKHLTLTLSLTATKDGYTFQGTASVLPLIYNERPSDWNLVTIEGLSDPPALSVATNTTVITVRAVDETNTPIAGSGLNVSYSDSSNLVAPEDSLVTSGAGLATFQVQVKAGAPNTAFKVIVRNVTLTNSGPAVITVTYRNATPPATARYAGYITYTIDGSGVAPFMQELGKLNATAHLYNDDGTPATGNASIVLSTTPGGDLATSKLTPYSTNFEGWGMVVTTANDSGAYVTGGPFCTNFDYASWLEWFTAEYIFWDWGTIVPVNITAGVLDIPIVGQDVATSDFLTQILVIPSGVGIFNGNTFTYEITGATSIEGDYAIQRGSHVTATSMRITTAGGATSAAIRVPNVGVGSARVYGFATDENNAPVAGANLGVFQAFLYYARATDFQIYPYLANPSRPDSTTTDADGAGFLTLVALANAGTASVVPATTTQVPVTAKASVPGTISLFCIQRATFVVQQGLLKLTPITEVDQIGSKVVVTAKVTDINGNGVPNIQVIMTVSGGAVLDTPTLGTDPTGVAKFTIDTSQMGAVRAAYITVSGSAAGPGYTISSCQLQVPVKNPGPVVSVGAPLGTKVDAENVTLQGSVTSPLGFTSVKAKLDNEATLTLSSATSDTVVALTHSFGKLSSGTHTIVINATDALGVSNEKTVTFTVASEGVLGGESSILPWAVAAIGWILFVIVAVMMMMRGRKPKETMAPGAEEVKEPPPERM
jgi:protocatechuate 3,4-dioxygenase beta subunit